MIKYLTIYIVSNLLILFLFEKLSKLFAIYDYPNERKAQIKKISLFGGIYIFFSIYTYFLFIIFSENILKDVLFSINTQQINFLAISFFIFFIGFIDDRNNLSPNKKIFSFLALILICVSIDPNLQILLLKVSFYEKYILLQNFSLVFTVFSIFIFINALNMYDGSNAQLGNYVLIFFIYLFYKTNFYLILIFLIPLIFFLYLNIINKTYMGNSGVYFLGFILSFLIIKIHNNQLDYINSDEIVLLMFFPVIDLARLFFLRLYKNLSPFNADRNHIHHLLYSSLRNNFKVQTVLFIISSFSLIIYEITKIECYNFLIINFLIYCFIIRYCSSFNNNIK